MSLEDEFSDVIAKAMKGLEIGAEDLAKEAGVSACEVSGLLHGDMDEAVLRKISPALGLDAEAVIALPSYMPAPLALPGIRRIELPFRQWGVNAWLLEKDGTSILFDTGFGRTDVLDEVSTDGLDAVLITHDHPDHVGGNAALESKGIRIVSEVEAMKRGTLAFGDLEIRVVNLTGHKSPAVGYVFDYPGVPVFVVGDAVFAGSMGGCLSKSAYESAFQTLREAFAGMPSGCVILPGHGPATTLGEEMRSNPFHSGFC